MMRDAAVQSHLEESGGNGEAIDGVGGVAIDGGLAWEASVSTSTFIPWLQCPIDPQMKYLFPGEVRGTTVLPPL
ncbi:unnamed protein product [Camellia sinensis]